MRLILTALLVCCFIFANAKTYYFSAVSGDDSRTSTQAQNPSTPWKTLSKLNSFFSSLQPGDFVLLKRGETFYGSITVNKSGTASAPITISDYGTGNRPVITSLVTLSGWTASSTYSGVYESSSNAALDAELSIVLLNGAQEPIGRYPNSDLPNKGYLTLESHVGRTSITDNQLTSTPNWTGADVIIRTCRWTLDKSKITSHSGTKITYSSPVAYYEPRDNYGYFIQNHIRTLDQLGEWYYNPSTKKISMYFGGNSPSSYSVQAATSENLVFSSSRSYVVFDNITFKGANGNGVYIMGGTNNHVNNCDILFSGIDGVKGSGTNFKLENSNILNSNNNGVNVSGGSAPIVRNNIIKNSYSIAGMGQSGNGQGAGVRNATKGLIEYNQIINTGYIGVSLGSDYAVVKNNLIDNFCFVKDDGAGIYTSNGLNITNVGRKIIGNIVINAIGAGAGTSSPASSSADGIYMDDNVNGVEITGNTVAHGNRGIFLHNSRGIILKDNTFYDHVTGQMLMKHDVLGDPLRNHTITNNIFFSKIATQIVASFVTKANDIGSFGTIDANYYARPIDDRITIYSHIYNLLSSQVISNLDLEGWKAKYGHDDISKRSAKQIAPFKLKSLIGSNKFANGAFNTSTGVNYIPQGKCVATWSNAGMLDGGYLKIVPSDVGSTIVISIGTLTAGKKYLLRYSVKGAGTVSLATYLRTGSPSYLANSAITSRKVTTARSDNEIMFTAAVNESNGAVVFKADSKVTYYLDNIQLYEADATITNPDDSIRFEYNASKVQKTVSLNGNYVDVKNNKYSNSIVLDPYESAVLIKNGGVTSPGNIAPTVTITDPVINESFIGPATINMEAIASDADGTISQVEFYNGTTLLVTEKLPPYTYLWDSVPAGNYTLIAKATDNNGLVSTSAGIPVSVVSQNGAPTVSIIKPANNINVTAPGTIDIEAAVDDPDGSISKVEFYNGTTLLVIEKLPPYTYMWDSIPAGNYTLTAKATDNEGNVTTSAGISVSVISLNASPTVTLIKPVNNTSLTAPATINMEATASDANGTISKVAFYNGTTLLHTETTAPYTYNWNNVPAGNYTITAKATDNDGNVTTSAGISVSVTSQNGAPTVALIKPVSNTSFTAPATISIEATASDANGTISKVAFYNGTALLHTETTAPYTYSWNNVPAGNYTLTAKATDNDGNVTTSAGIPVSVTSQNGAPIVALIKPVSNTSFPGPATISMEATATDANGIIRKVEFYNGTTLLWTETGAPWTYTWNNVPAGNYTLTAKATDDDGNVTTSAGIPILVVDVAPIVTLIKPANNTSFTAPATISMEATATDGSGTIKKVEFYNGSTLLHTETGAPWTYTWNNVPAGNYTLKAKATDNSGLVTSSAGVSVSVLNGTAISITSPASNELLSVTSDSRVMNSGGTLHTETSGLSDFKLFPNPAKNKIQVYFDGLQNNQKVNLSILDLSGRKLKGFPVRVSGKKIEVDISSLSTGVYIISLSGENFIINKKFSKIN